ncbi:MAG: hypothetical protein PHS53_02255 [Candidatus Pacebacteria bacterium]|nr:hypothetical protein [Candidatus Paceibacterota bacterium]MDD5356948.1 hypothetical protein [Candidatus Paceibacterota bacterium]
MEYEIQLKDNSVPGTHLTLPGSYEFFGPFGSIQQAEDLLRAKGWRRTERLDPNILCEPIIVEWLGLAPHLVMTINTIPERSRKSPEVLPAAA